MVSWVRQLRSGLTVSYSGLSFSEVVALATALDEWEMLLKKRTFDTSHRSL